MVAAIVLLQVSLPVAAAWYEYPPWECSNWKKAGSPSKSYVSIDATTGLMGVKVIDVGYAMTWMGYKPFALVNDNYYTIYEVSFRGMLDAYLKAPLFGYSALEIAIVLVYADGTVLDSDVIYSRSAWWNDGYEVDYYFNTLGVKGYVSDFYANKEYYICVRIYGISASTAGGRVVRDAGTTGFAQVEVFSIRTSEYYTGPKG
ncbi:MAG: hypothetical protein EAX95_04030 [Candidatus Thorarchaeota archaeon]|nr:hypothetical protein [Candidatus Thorarchaeota archaeon]